jgi:hypothetical protein
MVFLNVVIAIYVVWGALIILAGDAWIERMYEEGSWGRQHPTLLTFGFWLLSPPLLVLGGLVGLCWDLVDACRTLARRG